MDSKTLALYLGCECTEAGLSSRGNTLVSVSYDGYNESTIRTPQGSILQIRTSNIKPLLRPLSSMTEEDCKKIGWVYEYEGRRVNHRPENLLPTDFIYLLSKGFDLFGLIEKGEAVSMG